MDILLINPFQENIYGRGTLPPYPPLSLLYLGAVLLREGFSVEVVDLSVDFSGEKDFHAFVRKCKPDVVGFTTVTPGYNGAISLAESIKRMYNPFVIFGGPHPTAMAETVIGEKCVDGVVIGEGEETIVAFMKRKKRGGSSPLQGMLIKENGVIVRGKTRDFIHDLDALPFPSRSLLKHPERYSPPDALNIPVATVLTSRGCPYRCTFCQAPKIWGRTIRRRSVENVIAEIKMHIEQCNIREIHIADDDFSHDKSWTLQFLDTVTREIKGIRLYFMNGLRIDNVDREVLTEMKRAGFVNVGFGVESACQHILNRVRKGLKVTEIVEKFRMARSLGFRTWAFFVLGLPGETAGTVKKTIDFSLSLDPDFAKYFYLVPFPGTDVYDEFKSKGYLTTNDFSKYGIYTKPVFELPSITSFEIKQALLRAYLRFYFRPLKILRILLKIRTITEFRLNFRALLFLIRKVLKN